MITTNYDLCLERAVAAALGLADVKVDDAERPWERALDVVTSRQLYMGSRATQGNGRRRPRYYKINGCAREYRRATEGSEERAAKRIVLTERQLQSFGHERWAEGMVRDRARRSHLLFSGFGSEEPQIRHTALAISEEFRPCPAPPDGAADRSRDGEVARHWDYGAAPWFQVHKSALSFFQRQVLDGWHRAWSDPLNRSDSDASDSKPCSNLENWFGSNHRKHFGGTKDALTADTFWSALLYGWLSRQFIAAWARDGAAGRELKRVWAQRHGGAPPWAVLKGLVRTAATTLFGARRTGEPSSGANDGFPPLVSCRTGVPHGR